MSYLSSSSGALILFGFGITMLVLSKLLAPRASTTTSFLLADRKLGWASGAMSIAASWLWAPALFISVQVAYEKGLAGLFWFTVPNVLALMMFSVLAPKIREKMPEGFTLPQYILKRFGNKRLHQLYLFPYFFYQIMAVTVQLFAGGNLVALLTGIPLDVAMPILLLIALSYTLVAGLKASVLTDVLQLSMILGAGTFILPMVWNRAGGWDQLSSGFSGIEGIEHFLDPQIAFSFGVVTSIGLIAGALSDQQYWQRAFAIKKTDLKKAFLGGGLLFGLVPIALSTLGFFAVNLDLTLPEGIDNSMIGVQTVATLLPGGATLLFLIMLISGLSSTLDSGLSAASSLWVTDVKPESGVSGARLSMVIVGVLGLGIAAAASKINGFGLQHLWWVFNTIAACVMPPTLLSLYSDKISAKGAYLGILTSFIVGIPLFIYSNVLGDPNWIVGSALFVIFVSTGFSLSFKEPIE
jgi:urea-proton symporter